MPATRRTKDSGQPHPPLTEGALAALPLVAHALPHEQVLAQLAGSPDGITDAEARARLARHGPNALTGIAPPSFWRVLWDQLRSTVVALLVVAAALGALLGGVHEAVAIGAVLLVNVVIGFTVEWRARNAMESLRRADLHQACVLRAGVERQVAARDLVPGDVLDLDPGEAVTADARLIEAAELRVLEASLTGESEPVSKRLAAAPVDAVLAERTSMVFKGTMVAAGTARAVVVATGRDTEIGRVGLLVAETDVADTPLERRLAILGRHLVWISLAVAALVSVLGVVRGQDAWLMVQTGIALAIAAVPEGLPIVATICLALGMRRMVRRRALVRRLPAVETLGSVTVICTDKTGTLTANEMTVTAIWAAGHSIRVTGTGYAPVGGFEEHDRPLEPGAREALETCLRVAALANEATLLEEAGGWTTGGDPTEIALLTAAHKAGLVRDELDDVYPESAEVPFSSERMWMASIRRAQDGGSLVAVKGAPGRVLARCSRWLGPHGERPLDDTQRARLHATADALAARGLRVLALAHAYRDEPVLCDAEAIGDLVLVGFAGLVDPPAEGVQEAVHALREAGIRPVVITGDHRLTAEAVARGLGIAGPEDATLDGRELAQTTDDVLTERAGHTAVYSRVSPEQKLRIVAALQRAGEIVGMLGDGVNDAPALRKADIGVAMGGRGTDVAKETAGLVLQDDRFATIVAAVEEGRVIFDNLRKFIFFLFSCNLSEVLILMLATAAGAPIPLAPLQILWLNFVTDVFPALALATEPPEPDVLRRAPHDPDEAILSRPFLKSLAGHAMLLTASALVVFALALAASTDLDHARTMTFMTVAFSQTLHALNARSDRPVVFGRRLLGNPWMWGSFALVGVLQIAALTIPPLASVLGLVALSGTEWLVVLLASLFPLVAGQIWRAVRRA